MSTGYSQVCQNSHVITTTFALVVARFWPRTPCLPFFSVCFTNHMLLGCAVVVRPKVLDMPQPHQHTLAELLCAVDAPALTPQGLAPLHGQLRTLMGPLRAQGLRTVLWRPQPIKKIFSANCVVSIRDLPRYTSSRDWYNSRAIA
jgi:hypothetical protein